MWALMFLASAPRTTIISEIFVLRSFFKVNSIRGCSSMRARGFGEPNLELDPAAKSIQETIRGL